MDFNVVLTHYRESQNAFWQTWGFLCRSYLLLRKVNPLLGDGIAVLGGIVGLLVVLEVFTLVSKIFSEKYIVAACKLQRGICKVLRWLFSQTQKVLKLMAALCRVLRKKSLSNVVSLDPIAPDTVPVQSQTIDREQLAIESQALLLKVLDTDARHRTEMRRLLCEADTKLQLLGCNEHASLIAQAMTQSKGTRIKEYAQSILEMSL